MSKRRGLKVGDWVQVRTREEVLATLDRRGCLDGMPFMPEMFAFCGMTFRVLKRAHKTCDTVFPIRARRVDAAVHLDARCDGQAHGGCQAGCLIFWKEAWLRRVGGGPRDAVGDGGKVGKKVPADASGAPCSEANVWAQAKRSGENGSEALYVCQATQLPDATRPLAWWDVRQYVEDYRSGNVGVGRILSGLVYSIFYHVSQSGIGVGPPMEWFYDRFHRLWGGTEFPRRAGIIPEGRPTPTGTLNLQPGELVRVKPYAEILQTLTIDRKNRGMAWDAEMVPYCGGTFRVTQRVTRIMDERSGRIQELRNPCIALDGVVCQARFSGCRMFCPRSIRPYWREIWLERVGVSSGSSVPR